MHICTVIMDAFQSLKTERNKYIIKRDLDDDSDGAHLTSFGIEFQTEEQAKENERSPCVALLCAGLLRRGMVYEFERVLRVCDGFSCSISWCSTAVAVVAQTSYFVCASYFNRKPMK